MISQRQTPAWAAGAICVAGFLLASCCVQEIEFSRIKQAHDVATDATYRTTLDKFYREQQATPEEALQITTVGETRSAESAEEATSDHLATVGEHQIIPAAELANYRKPDEPIVAVSGAVQYGDDLPSEYKFARRKDGHVLAIRMEPRVMETKSIKICRCDPGSGVAERPPPRRQNLYWVRVDKPEDVEIVKVSYDVVDVKREQAACAEPAP